jgi:myosin protein heavy chain
VDLDALGLNSTFESSGIDLGHAPKVDVVDTSDMGGPEDFTMNMTYWMTADLPLSQIKSRKEANSRIPDVRGDANQSLDILDSTEEGDKAVLEDTTRDRVASEDFNFASPTVRVNGSADNEQDQEENALLETSMENEEKVMSYLSALPDTDMHGAITSTPLRVAKENALQVPTPGVPRARSLQPTVEDYETPRKPTQETVIHHVSPPKPHVVDPEHDTLGQQLAELQSRMEQQELASKTRITELETTLSYTRSELDAARTESSKQKDTMAELRKETERLREEQLASKPQVATQTVESEDDLRSRMENLGEELRLQGLAKLQSQREEFERELMASEEAKRAAEGQLELKDQLIAQMRKELDVLRQSKEQEVRTVKAAHSKEQQQHEQSAKNERDQLNEQLSALQERADSLQKGLEKATLEAQTARKAAETAPEATTATSSLPTTSNTSHQGYMERIHELEDRNRSLASQLDSLRADLSTKDQQILRSIEEQDRLECQLSSAEGRNEGLEATLSSLRQQLADAHRESAKARTDFERYEKDLEAWEEWLEDAGRESDRRVADVERKLSKMKDSKADVEARLMELRSEHETMIEDHETQIEDVRSNAEDAVRKVGAMLEAERSEKRKLAKELKRCNEQLDKLRAEAAKKTLEESDSEPEEEQEEEEDISTLSTSPSTKSAEISNLRNLVKSQASLLKTLKTEITTLRKATRISTIQGSELSALREENESLKSTISVLESEAESQRAESEAINKAMDERLAAMLSKMLKERSRAIAGKRDDQWVENVGRLKGEKELLGKVLMREWGKQECGAAKEEEREKQVYRYQYVKRS